MPNYLLLKLPDSVDVDSLKGGMFTMLSKEGFQVTPVTELLYHLTGDGLEESLRMFDKLTLAEGINVLREGARLLKIQSLIGHLGLRKRESGLIVR